CSCLLFVDPSSTAIYTLSLHDALPISAGYLARCRFPAPGVGARVRVPPVWHYRGCWRHRRPAHPESAGPVSKKPPGGANPGRSRSEEHTSELQSLTNLVCRLLLEKKNN